jgi:toluene monooxygenase system protein E
MTAKTYSHLATERRIPGEYDVVTSQLHYYVRRGGFEVRTPLSAWYERYQMGSPLRCPDWDRFRDPRETTYTRYTALQRTKETQIDGVLHSIEYAARGRRAYDASLSPECLDALERAVTPLRFLFHGFQMASAYVGQMAPSGRVTIAAALQAADEMRRIQRIAFRMAQIRRLRPTFGDPSKALWQEDPAWQPLRRCVEDLLVTYDWGEALTALDLCVKPVSDFFFMGGVPAIVKGRGDHKLEEIFLLLGEDCAWHRRWSGALVTMAVEQEPRNRGPLASWIARWLPRAEEAIAPFSEALPDGGPAAVARARAQAREWLHELKVV